MKQSEVRAIWEKLRLRQGSAGSIMLSDVEEAIGEVVGIEGDEDFPEPGEVEKVCKEKGPIWNRVVAVLGEGCSDMLTNLCLSCGSGSSMEVYRDARELKQCEERLIWAIKKRDDATAVDSMKEAMEHISGAEEVV